MEILNDFLKLFNISSYEISERNLVVESKFLCSGKMIPPVEDIEKILKRFPTRDDVKVTLSNVYDNVIVLTNDNSEIEDRVKLFYEESEDDEEVGIYLEINKSISDNIISVYNYESFSNYILKKSLFDIMKVFQDWLYNKEYVVFELFDSDLLFFTNTIMFKSYNENKTELRFERSKNIKNCNEISYFYNSKELELIPDDFEILSSYKDNPYEQVFQKINTLLSLIYISNTATIQNNVLQIQISGQRNISKSYDLNSDIPYNKELYKIYKWILTDGNLVDKSIIARNIISFHCKYTDVLLTDEKTFSSIRSNFTLYQKDNVVKYIELKNKLAEYIINIVTQTSEIVIGLSDGLKRNVFAVFTFLLTVIIANIVSDKPLNNIFTKDVTFLLEMVLFGSVGYMGVSVVEMNYKLKKLEEGYNELRNNYDGLLDTNDIKEIFKNNKIFNDNVKEVKTKRLIIILVWIFAIILCLIGIEVISTSPLISRMIFNK